MAECHGTGQKWYPSTSNVFVNDRDEEAAVGETFIVEAGRSGSQLVTSVRKVSAIPQRAGIMANSLTKFRLNTLRTGSFKLFKRPFPEFLTILTL